ncbi:MAG: hypothetical protein ACKVOM_00380 [Ferruginibacter sp.]
MKRLLIYIGLIISFHSTIGQNSIIGCYGREDSQIALNANSSFFFFYAVDTNREWLKGTWGLNGKKLIFTPKIVYDTAIIKKGDLSIDSLILSRDYTSERIIQTNNRVIYMFQYEQNEKLCPQVLTYKGHTLYVINNKKLQKKKIKNGYYKEPFNAWYTKDKCKY